MVIKAASFRTSCLHSLLHITVDYCQEMDDDWKTLGEGLSTEGVDFDVSIVLAEQHLNKNKIKGTWCPIPDARWRTMVIEWAVHGERSISSMTRLKRPVIRLIIVMHDKYRWWKSNWVICIFISIEHKSVWYPAPLIYVQG